MLVENSIYAGKEKIKEYRFKNKETAVYFKKLIIENRIIRIISARLRRSKSGYSWGISDNYSVFIKPWCYADMIDINKLIISNNLETLTTF